MSAFDRWLQKYDRYSTLYNQLAAELKAAGIPQKRLPDLIKALDAERKAHAQVQAEKWRKTS